MERKAVDSCGILGSLYDGYRDCVLGQLHMSLQTRRLPSRELATCLIINGNTDASRNLLESIGIQDELRLSLLLNLRRRTGIAAVLNHPLRINEDTRFLFYSWTSRKEQWPNKATEIRRVIELGLSLSNATHIITGIKVGIDFVIVLQLPSEVNTHNQIDLVLQKMCSYLSSNNEITLALTSQENGLLRKFTDTTVYSNISALNGLTKVSNILRRIYIIKKNSNYCRPIAYSLRPVTWLYSQYIQQLAKFNPLTPEFIDNIEQYMLQLSVTMKHLEASLNKNVPKLLCGYLKDRLNVVHNQWLGVMNQCMREIERYSKLIVGIRKGQVEVFIIDRALYENEQKPLKNTIEEMTRSLNDLETKGQLITNLRQQQFKYWNAVEYDMVTNDDLRTIQDILIDGDQLNRVLCSNDILNERNQSQFNKLRNELVEEHQRNPNLQLIYADFSYSSFELNDMVVLHSDRKQNEKITLKQKEISSSTSDIINILLLGETGVEKSTFINAFANYLLFNSLEQAQSNKPVVPIPVPFLTTTGNHSEEYKIKLEDLHHSGQSVTQPCRSYLFEFHRDDEKKLRIIDTPSLGDTRGVDQDELNMEEILHYINNLTHLNAVCFLLESNSSRLNKFFQSCLTQLFSLLSPTARKNIIFCFANARSTSADATSILKDKLQSLSTSDIPINNENTFCFDNESFRYLVSLQNGLSFNHVDKPDYKTNWFNSVKESNRLLHYIRVKLTPYRMQGDWQTIKQAEFEIIQMIRPMLETMRNILRNIILREMNLSKEWIEMRPKALAYPASLCISCKPNTLEVGKFLVLPDLPHEIRKNCVRCSCPSDRHIPIDYMLTFESLTTASNLHQNDRMNDTLNELCDASAEFAYFLIYIARSTKDDMVLTGLMEMIVEENGLSNSQNHLNLPLVKKLITLQNLYEQRIDQIKSNNEQRKLPFIYNLINQVRENRMVREQMVAVKGTQQMMMRHHEHVVKKI